MIVTKIRKMILSKYYRDGDKILMKTMNGIDRNL